MTFAREKRLILGVLAFVAPLPLPLNEPRPEGVVGWPFLLAYLVAVAFFLHRASQGARTWLRPWMLNGLGLLYLPFFLFDFSTFWRGHLVRPMMHLVMFALVVKLFALHRERDKWHVAVGIFFLFLASMATSAHFGIVLYLLLFFSCTLWMLIRFAIFHVATAYGAEGQPELPSMRTFLLAATVLSLAAAVPLFLLLPRVRTPYVIGGSFTGTQVGYSTGFSDEVSLDIIGNIRSSREVALRAQFESGTGVVSELRFRGASYDRYQGLRWLRSGVQERMRRADGRYRLSDDEIVDRVHIWLQPLDATSLILPVQAVDLRIPLRSLILTRGGTLAMRGIPSDALHYEVGLAATPVYNAEPPIDADATLEANGITPRLAALAAEVGGDGSVSEKARRIESHLIRNYEYTLDFVGRRAENPIDDFLFEYGSGHCEYFASAMVLMLRSQGIPARFITGFLGGEHNPLEGYFVVRQSNAHAWVEAYLPGQGWKAYDPTPPAGRPVDRGPGLRLLMQQVYDYLLFRWDRYVLSYGFEDQVSVLSRLRSLLSDLWSRLAGGEEAPAPSADTTLAAEPEGTGAEARAPDRRLPFAVAWSLLALLAGAASLWYLRRPPLSATRAYLRLRRRAARRGLKLTDAVAPRGLQERLGRQFPEAARASSRLIRFYLRESFRGETLSEEERRQVEDLLDRASKGLRKAS